MMLFSSFNRSFKTATLSKSLPGLLSCTLLTSLLLSGLAFADNYHLQRIDLNANPGSTQLTLYSDSNNSNPIPWHTVMASDNKIMIDFDQVHGDRTIQTNFDAAANVSHVVIQPLSEDRMRLVIRGEDLAPPNVSFHSAQVPMAQSATPASSFQNTNMIQTDNAVMPVSMSAVEQPASSQATPATADALTPASTTTAFNPIKTETSSLKTARGHHILTGHTDESFVTTANQIIDSIDWLQVGQYGLLVGLFIFLSLFIRHKIKEMVSAQTETDPFERLREEQKAKNTASQKKPSFEELAQAYQQAQQEAEGLLISENPNQKADKNQKKSAGWLFGNKQAASKPANKAVKKGSSLIGLNALQNLETAEPTQPVLTPPPAVTRPASQPIQTSAPGKQVVNQYLKQQPSPAKKPQAPAAGTPATRPAMPNINQPAPGRNAAVSDQILRQETARAREIQRTASAQRNPLPGRPAAPSLKAGQQPQQRVNRNVMTSQSPASRQAEDAASNNPEVLNFLRDVANLMEKQGKPNMARAIEKNIRPM